MQPSYLQTYHKGYNQSGNGLGNLFASALKVAVPIFKKIVAPATKRVVRKAAPHAFKLGEKVISDVLSGQSVKKSLKRRAPAAALNLLTGPSTSSYTKPKSRKRVKKTRVRSRRRDIFST